MELWWQYGADYLQGAVVLGVVVALYVGWHCLSECLAWNQDTAETALGVAYQAHQEIDALKTRVKSLEDAAGRAKRRDAEKQRVRVAKVGGAA